MVVLDQPSFSLAYFHPNLQFSTLYLMQFPILALQSTHPIQYWTLCLVLPRGFFGHFTVYENDARPFSLENPATVRKSNKIYKETRKLFFQKPEIILKRKIKTKMWGRRWWETSVFDRWESAFGVREREREKEYLQREKQRHAKSETHITHNHQKHR